MKSVRYIKGDRVIWMVIILLSVISLLAVYSSSQSLAISRQGGSTIYFLVKQMIVLCIGLFVIVLTHHIPYRYFSKLSQLFFYMAIPLSGRDPVHRQGCKCRTAVA